MSIELILDQCLDEIRQRRASIEECVARYPQHSEELARLLQTALAFDALSDVQPSPEFKKTLRERILGFSTPEQTDGIRDLLTSSDAGQNSVPEDADESEEDDPDSVWLISPGKRDA